MATIENIRLTYNRENFFNGYKSFLEGTLTAAEKTELGDIPGKIEVLNGEISTISDEIVTLEAEITALKESLFAGAEKTLADIEAEITDLSDKLSTISTLINKNRRLTELRGKSTLTSTESSEKLTLEGEVAALLPTVASIRSFINTNFAGKIENVQNRIDSLTELKGKMTDLTAKNILKGNKVSDKGALEARQSVLAAKVNVADVANFKSYLTHLGLQDGHATEVLEILMDPSKELEVDPAKAKTRKQNKWISKVKKFATGVGVLGVTALIIYLLMAGMVGGATLFGFIPAAAKPGLTDSIIWGTSAISAGALTTGYFFGKSFFTKLGFKLKYRDAKKNLEDYTKDPSKLDTLYITQLMNKIEKTNQAIMDTYHSKNWFTGICNWIKRHTLNIVNRNAVHHLQKYAEDLTLLFKEIDLGVDSPSDKAAKLLPIYELLQQIQTFIKNDNDSQKLHELLTCKNVNDVHTYENDDIYYAIQKFINEVASATTIDELTKKTKSARNVDENIQAKNAGAKKVLNENLSLDALGFESKYGIHVTRAGSEIVVESTTLLSGGSEVLIKLEDGRCIKVPATDAVNHEHIKSAKIGRKSYKLVYEDGSVVEVNKPVQVLKEVIGFRIVLLDKLTNDATFVADLKTLGHKATTITSLKNKLTTWLADTTKTWTISSSSPMFSLYNDAYTKIKTEGVTV